MTTEQWERENQDTLMEYFIDGDPSVRRIQCECCRKIIYTQTRNRKYCSFQTCGHKMLNLRKSLKKRVERGTYTCPCCGEQFLPIRADARYCSNACRQKDYRQRTRNKISGSKWPTEKAGRADGRDSQIFACQLARCRSAEGAALCPSDMMLCVICYWVLSGAKQRQIQQLRCCVLPAKKLKRRDVYLKLTRHNGRAGTHGTYNPKHNDRSFNLANSEHIDSERAKGNIYWDCYHGFRSALDPQDPDDLAVTFSDVERQFYETHYCVHMPEAEIRSIMTKYLKADSSNGSAEVNSTSIRTAAGFICSYIRNCQRQEQGRIFLEDAMVMLGEYLSSDIESNLKSNSPFINALAVLDRRVGKRRLQKISDRGSSVAPKWAWPFYKARFEAEGIKCSWNFNL